MILLLATLFYLVPHKLIKIKKIECISSGGGCLKTLTDKLSLVENKSYSDSMKYIETTVKNDIALNSYSVRYVFPDKLKLFIVENEATCTLTNPQMEGFLLVDKNGKIIRKESLTSLPVVKLNETFDYKVGDKISDKYLFACGIIEDINSVYNKKLAVLENNSLDIMINDSTKAVFPLSGDRNLLIGSVRLILSRLNESGENSRIKTLDLRYKNPVIIYTK